MKYRFSNPTAIGLFVVVGLMLGVAAIITIGGGRLWTRKERAVMHFSGSIYGLQVGAPVVFRGVRLGSVRSVAMRYDAGSNSFAIPVEADLETSLVQGLTDDGRGSGLKALLDRGLRAQLAMQSLLTGQLYVDLDLRPEKPAVLHGHDDGPIEIPTNTTAIQTLKEQLESIDLRKLMDQVGELVGNGRELLTGPRTQQLLKDVSGTAAQLRQLATGLNKRSDPLVQSADRMMSRAGDAADRVGRAADGLRATAGRFDTTADRANALLDPANPLLGRLQTTADELARAATAVRTLAEGGQQLPEQADRTLGDLAKAARALRELADGLAQQPDALLRGAPAPAPWPGTSASPRTGSNR